MRQSIRTALTILTACLAAALSATALAQTGRVERIQVSGKSLEGNLLGQNASPEVSVYLPPGYDRERRRRYAVVYVLHGYSGTDLNWFGEMPTWDGRGAADRTMAAGSVEEMIVVMPNCMNAYGGCMYANSAATGYWEDYVADDLVAYIDANYRTIPDRTARGLTGHSMGGYGVWLIGMHRPDVFSALYSLSACCLNEYAPQGGDGAAAFESITTAEGLGFGARRTFAVTSAWSPNPDKPPLYMDLPTVNGEVVPAIAARFAVNSPQAMVPSFASALRKYAAIQLDVGEQDGLIGSNRELSEMLTKYGVEHIWETYEGDHINRITQRFEGRVLPFMSEHLIHRAPR